MQNDRGMVVYGTSDSAFMGPEAFARLCAAFGDAMDRRQGEIQAVLDERRVAVLKGELGVGARVVKSGVWKRR